MLGYPDGQHVRPDEMLAMIGRIAQTVPIPVTADLEVGPGGQVATAADLPFVLNARVDVYLHWTGDAASRFAQIVQRTNAYRDAGADCLFIIG